MSNNADKKVSIIIPCFNQAKFVEEAITSALNQTYKNIEIICVNDCSTDNSKEVISKFKNIKFIDLKENKGVINARNLAIDASSGEYILPLDADDIIEPTYVEKAAKILNENPEIGIVYCKAKFFGTKNEYWDLPEFSEEKMYFTNCIFVSALFRKRDFLKVNKYKENMQSGCEDWDLWLSIIEEGFKVYKINEILFYYRQHSIKTRMNAASESTDWHINLILNHLISFSIKNPELAKQTINNEKIKKEKYQKKCKKYKTRYTITLIGLIIEFLILSIGSYIWITK